MSPSENFDGRDHLYTREVEHADALCIYYSGSMDILPDAECGSWMYVQGGVGAYPSINVYRDVLL